MEQKNAFYRTIWRWHFYAGLFVMPFILILSVTGAIYLFKPQVERWEERSFQGLPTANAVSANAQLAAALAAYPGAQFSSYRLPEIRGDAARIHLAMADGETMRDIFVSPTGKVLGSIDPDARVMETVSSIHGSLLLGRVGGWMVELAASWAIVMILTGMYLWWPNTESGGRRAMAGVVWPRMRAGKRIFWRDLHAVTGFWVSGLALVLLVTGMPWASVWGDAFKMARTELGLINGKQDWKTGAAIVAAADEHAGHDHDAMLRMQAKNMPLIRLGDIVARAAHERLAFPVFIKAPDDKNPMAWTVKSDAQDRPQRVTITYDMASRKELSREDFADRHPIDRAVGYGIAWHEGQLFGWINQTIGVLTACALITLMISGFVMWRRRKPTGSLGAPPASQIPARMGGVVIGTLILAVLLPMLALSLVALFLIDRCVIARLPVLRVWLGVPQN